MTPPPRTLPAHPEEPPLKTKREILAHVTVCLGCCCGRTDKDKPDVPSDWLKTEWKNRKLLKHVQLTISGCLGPCDLANVVCIGTPEGYVWLGNVRERAQYADLLNWAEHTAQAGVALPLPEWCAAHRFERFQPTSDTAASTTNTSTNLAAHTSANAA